MRYRVVCENIYSKQNLWKNSFSKYWQHDDQTNIKDEKNFLKSANSDIYTKEIKRENKKLKRKNKEK